MRGEDQSIKLVEVIADSALGGGPKHVLGILKHIDKKKFKPFLICPSGYLSVEARDVREVEVFNFNPKSKFDFIALLRLRRILQTIQSSGDPFAPMIVHSHGSRAGFFAGLAVIYGIKNVYTEHRFDESFHLKNKWNEWIQKKMLAKETRKADLVIAVSGAVRDFLIKHNFAKKEKVIIIPNAIELEGKTKEKRVKTQNKTPIIGTIGNLNVQKGHRYLIEAMSILKKKYPLITLEIIGGGEGRIALLELIERLGLDHHVSLLGQKKDADKYLHHWDVFILPSIAETFGIVLLEAMKEGVPIVASKVGGVTDIITNNKNGLLVPSSDPGAIAEAVSKLLDHPVLAAKLKNGGKERLKEFDWKVIIKRLEEEYLGLCK